MTAVDVDALDKLREAATAGPWHVVQDEDVIEVWSPAAEVAAYSNPADAALIVTAVNALPDLLAEVRRSRALREAVERVRELHSPFSPTLAICVECSDELTAGWPCPTILALDGKP